MSTSRYSPDVLVLVGLVGGVASGKSTVARRLATHGAIVIDADRWAHEALEEETVRQAVRERFGASVFDESGRVIRSALARQVFSDEGGKAALEALIHPHVRTRIEGRLEELRSEVTAGRRAAPVMVVLDVPLLLETPWADRCDHIVFVETSAEQRSERAQRERGWSATEVAQREKFQKPVNAKRRRSDYVIDNSNSLERTDLQVDELYRELSGSTSRERLPHIDGGS